MAVVANLVVAGSLQYPTAAPSLRGSVPPHIRLLVDQDALIPPLFTRTA